MTKTPLGCCSVALTDESEKRQCCARRLLGRRVQRRRKARSRIKQHKRCDDEIGNAKPDDRTAWSRLRCLQQLRLRLSRRVLSSAPFGTLMNNNLRNNDSSRPCRYELTN